MHHHEYIVSLVLVCMWSYYLAKVLLATSTSTSTILVPFLLFLVAEKWKNNRLFKNSTGGAGRKEQSNYQPSATALHCDARVVITHLIYYLLISGTSIRTNISYYHDYY